MLQPCIQDMLSHLPPFRLQVVSRCLHFRKPATTSRGALRERRVYYIIAAPASCKTPLSLANHQQSCGIGECATMPGLSKEAQHGYEQQLHTLCQTVERLQSLPADLAADAPSLRFGLESALLTFLAGSAAVWDTPFTRGEHPLRIHHLVWMDTREQMQASLERGGRAGASCLKLKVGALPFDQELEMLREVAQQFPKAELRVDANGAFSPKEVEAKLEALAQAGVSLIEQPLRPGCIRELAALCKSSPLPIALDEELIAPNTTAQREALLDALMPAAIVIKPSLHGGLCAAEHWAALADERGIRRWINSALESHVGHAMLAQWCGLHAADSLHGLGTGDLFSDDRSSHLRLQHYNLWWKNDSFSVSKI